FSNLSPVAPAHRDFLIKRVQRTIQEHEPRLTNITVTMPKDHDVKGSLQMRFQVAALLLMDPAPEPVAYDTLLELSSGEYQVKGD
ncbi:MAG: GPW/gp25 family protein, partial [Bryobacterales bacterium]|nr:GPW/gp25 family protein [Bryobacterales bacterium]